MTTFVKRQVLSPPYPSERCEQIVSASRRLWGRCFTDDEAFVRFYFSAIADPQQLHQLWVENRAVAQIHVPIYNVVPYASSSALPLGYISGACTEPEYEGQGIMTELLTSVLRYQYEQGHAGSFLIPASDWLRAYYERKFGYYTKSYRYTTEDIHAFLELGREDSLPPIMLQHSAQQWDNVLQEYKSFAHILTLDVEGEQAVALYRVEDGLCYIDTLRAATLQKQQELLTYLLESIKLPRYVLRLPSASVPNATKQPLAMLRPLRPLLWLQAYLHQVGDESFDFTLEDPLISENTGRYLYDGTSLRFLPNDLGAPSISLGQFTERYVPEMGVNLIHD